MKTLSAFAIVLVLIPGTLSAQETDEKTPVSFPLRDFDENESTLKKLLRIEDFSKPGVLILMTEADDQVLSLVRNFDRVVIKNEEEKGTSLAVVYLSNDEGAIEVTGKKLASAKLRRKGGFADEVPDIYKISTDERANVVKVVAWKDSLIKLSQEMTAEELKDADAVTNILVEFLSLLDE